MNKQAFSDARAIMQRVIDNNAKLDMRSWQKFKGRNALKTFEEIHSCGTAACFGEYVAVSPEFKLAGGFVGCCYGSPIFKGFVGFSAISAWLSITHQDSRSLCASASSKDIYEKPVKKITPQDVLAALDMLEKKYSNNET